MEAKDKVGNAAKLRDALIKSITMLAVCEWPDGTNMEGVDELMRDIDAALDVPPRNCDVGTADEQYERFMNMCNSKDARQCAGCRMRGFKPGCSRDRCFANWAQMPYEEGDLK